MNLAKTSKAAWMLLLAVLIAAPAVADDRSDENDGEASEETETPLLDRVQVTARRREESLQAVPISVTALSGEALDDVGAQAITYLQQAVPNTTIEVSRGTSSTLTAFIRGIGQQDPVAGFESGVGIYLDDIYLNRPQGAVLDIYDVERIEVLRGPQGTLYGRNTIGGAVKYVTKRLGHEPALQASGSLGSHSQRDLVLKGEIPLGVTLAFGASAAMFTRDGYGTNLTTGEENYDKDVRALRASMEWTPHSNFFMRLAGDYVEDRSSPVGSHRLIPGLFSGAPVLADVYDSRGGIEGPNKSEQQGLSLLAEYNMTPAWTFKSITAYREDDNVQQIDFDALPAADVDVPTIYENEQFSQEFQLVYSGELVNGVAGFYYLDANAFHAFDVLLATTGDLIDLPGLNAFTLGDVDTETWSLFADVSFNLAGFFNLDTGLELSLGGRYTSDERSSRVLRQTMIGGNSEFHGGEGVPIETTSDFEGSAEYTDFSPRVSLSWKPTFNHNLYVSYSQGFKGGSFDPRGATTAAPDLDGDGAVSEQEIFEFMRFKPEEVDTWEIGAKSSFAGGRFNTNLALFYSDYTDIQVPGSIGVDTTGDGISDTFTGVTTNAGAATVKGVELEANAILANDIFGAGDEFTTALALGYIDAGYDEFITAVTDPATGETSLQDVSDQRVIQNTPKRTAHWNLRYSRPMPLFGNEGTFSAIAAWSYRSRTHQFETPSAFLDQPGYSLYDLHLVWRRYDGRYAFSLHGRNLADKEYKVSGYVFATPDGSAPTLGLEGVMNAFYGAPRTVTANFQVSF